MTEPGISVIIPVLNGAAWIHDLLVALQHQVGVGQPHEIVVADNGSTDGTPDIASRLGARVLLVTRGRGPSYGRNAGLHAARGEWIANLDCDTLPTRAWLAALTQRLADPGVVLVGGRSVSYLPETPAELFIARFDMHAFEFSTGRALFPFRASRNLAYRRDQALKIGGWAEDMPTAEDIDFCHRLKASCGGTQEFAGDAVLFHRERSDDRALRHQAWTYGEGLAHMYLRYPTIARWTPARTLQLAGVLFLRTARRAWVRAATRLHRATMDDVIYTRYHAMWSDAYWGGFRSMLRHKRRLAPPWERGS